MQSLFCQAADCMHNKAGHCGANVIQVSNSGSKTFCDTYAKSDTFVASEDNYMQYTSFASQMINEFGEDFDNPPKVTCNVGKCAYNRSFHCTANDVQIAGAHESTQSRCKTYRPK